MLALPAERLVVAEMRSALLLHPGISGFDGMAHASVFCIVPHPLHMPNTARLTKGHLGTAKFFYVFFGPDAHHVGMQHAQRWASLLACRG
jgi:hypothetical protein